MTRLCFAYGSNISVAQMAKRCPGSHYYGRAILSDYKWQINQRGVANIIPSPGDCVHGLVYILGGGGSDEDRLNKAKGINKGYYDKTLLEIIVYPAPDAVQMRTIDMVDLGGASAVVRRQNGRERAPRMEHSVLAYVSTGYVRDGEVREEYVGRMNTAIADGITLGIPKGYFKNVVREFIPEERSLMSLLLPRARSRARSVVVVGGRDRGESDDECCGGEGVEYRKVIRRRSRSRSRGRGREDVEDVEYEYGRRPV